MHRRSRSETGDLSSPRSSRAPSFSSDRPSVAGAVTFQMPPSVRPPPAYIAASVASQIVTDHHNAQLRDDHDSDHEQDHDQADELTNALFSEQALNLLNGFLDHLLFSFLSTARSPSLTSIRPAIAEVLKPRLAREAMVTADDELQGLLGGDEDEEFPERGNVTGDNWDVEKVWKRTRLRIMVYTRLGELEDEDEERYVQQERGLSMDDNDDDDANLVSWASAIFLTSVIEYIAEQTLLVSGQASYTRMSAKLKKIAPISEHGEEMQLERIIVEDFDVEKVALNSTLGRLWRTWRKRVRSPIIPLSPSRGPRSVASLSSLHRRRISRDTIEDCTPEVPEHKPTETEIAANIPLPMSDNDVNEIEVPGLARTFDEDESTGTQTPVIRPQRPSSVIMLAPAENFRRRLAKERPVSMPPPESSPFTVSTQAEAKAQDAAETAEELADTETAEATDVEQDFVTPMERASDDESYIMDERQEGMPNDDDYDEADADMLAFAASTGMGFGMSPVISTKSSGFDKEDDDTIDTPTQNYGAPKVFESKRMSIEKTGPPGIVRTFSSRSSRSSPMQTPSIQTPEARSYLEDAHDDHDLSGPEAIGVAHTSNVPIAATPSPPPPAESVPQEKSESYVKQKQPDHQGFVELAPRQVTSAGPSAPASRKTPSPVKEPIPQQKSVQRREVQQEKPMQRREVPQEKIAQRREAPQEKTPQRREAPKENNAQHREVSQENTAQRREGSQENVAQRKDVSTPKLRTAALPSLQEAENRANKQQESPLPKKPAFESQRSSPLTSSPKQSGAVRARDSPVAVTERSAKRKSLEVSPISRTGPGDVSPVEKSTLKRVSSSSSTTKSVGTSILHAGRDSEGSITRSRGLSGRMSEEDRQREFDSLVKGDETVKFTLTPQAMRDMDEPPVSRKVEQQPKQPASTVTVYPRVNADKDNQFGSQPMPARTGSRNKGTMPSGGRPTSYKKSVGPKPLAREPRIQSDSMRDFADFIRSTGPQPGQEKPVQPFVSLSGSASQSPNNSTTAVSGLGRRLSTKQGSTHSKSNSSVVDAPSAKPRIHMEPRSPAGQRSGNDDLIDFIRQGPPGQNNGQHRIPRSVAPFRSTVDSDQFDRMLDDNGNVESAYGSQVSTHSKQSNHTSNSRTGLLPSPHVVQPAYSSAPQKLSGNMSSSEPQVKRTRRRVKDPYAIDVSDDEDDDLLTALPASNRRQEESLMDFLNSMEPPPANEPQPLLLNGATVAAAKARASSGSNSSLPSTSSSGTVTRNGVNSRPSKPLGQPAVISASVTSEAPRAHKPKFQARPAGARDPRAGRSATNDLADFLRSSGPPEPPAPAPSPTLRKDEGKRSNARFWRKKIVPDTS